MCIDCRDEMATYWLGQKDVRGSQWRLRGLLMQACVCLGQVVVLKAVVLMALSWIQ
jgi:hypothetical protein